MSSDIKAVRKRLRSRNESMAHAMVVAGMKERRGGGWLVMRRAMRSFNGTEPELINDEDNKIVCVTFRLNPELAGDDAQRQQP